MAPQGVRRRVLVIGAGASGLTALKECLAQGHDVICFEADKELGGLWKFTEHEGHSSVYRSTVINTCKEMMSYSDFPIPREYPPFLHNSQVVEYFKQFVEHFDLGKHIHFNTRVELVKPAADFATTRNYSVTYRRNGGEPVTEDFEVVLACSGHHWKPRMPTFPGQDKFKGRIIHSKSYKDADPYRGKNVVVVGIGNSGLDVSVEISRFTKQTYLVSRNGAHIFNRLGPGSRPLDYMAITRLSAQLPESIVALLLEHLFNDNASLERFGIRPKHGAMSAHPSINGEFFGRAATGSIVTRPQIREIREHSVVYEDGLEFPCDEIILATGYEIGFPFLDPSCNLTIKDNHVDLYKWVFPPTDGRPSLAFIGLIQPWGAIMPISEIQARWVARILSGRLSLPSAAQMKADIRHTVEDMARRYIASPRHTIQVDYVQYCDMIGEFIGCTPRFWPLFFRDPQLALVSYLRGAVPYTYRLFGPDQWPGARKAIMEASKNMEPINCRTSPYQPTHSNMRRNVIIILVILLILRRLARR